MAGIDLSMGESLIILLSVCTALFMTAWGVRHRQSSRNAYILALMCIFIPILGPVAALLYVMRTRTITQDRLT